MKKKDEIVNPNSCLNKAQDDEILFVLLERDESTPDAIREWIASRIRKGKNKPDDQKLIDAEETAKKIEEAHGK